MCGFFVFVFVFVFVFLRWGVGAVIGGLNSRRGTIVDSEVREDEFTAIAEVALNDMFGYSSQLRGATQGKGTFYLPLCVDILVHSLMSATR